MQLDNDLAETLQKQTIGVSVQFKKLGVSKKVDDDSKAEALSVLEADAERFSLSEKIIGKECVPYKNITKHLSSFKGKFEKQTIDTSIKTVRLMNIRLLPVFQDEVVDAQQKLSEMVEVLQGQREEIIENARVRLGRAFDESHFPETFAGTFAIDVTYPTIGPDKRLEQLNPELYAEQERRLKDMFERAIQDTTWALADQLSTLIGKLTEKLTERKRIRADALEPLNNFLDLFENVRLGTTGALQTLVSQAREIVNATDADSIRRNPSLRSTITDAMLPIREGLDGLIQARPERMLVVV